MTTTGKRITISLSERGPVSLDTSEWPRIAWADDWSGSEHECQASETMMLCVRRRRDVVGVAMRTRDVVVYGERDRGAGGMPISYRGSSAGYLLTCDLGAEVPQAEIVRAIRRVAGVIGWTAGAAVCIADLPVEEI